MDDVIFAPTPRLLYVAAQLKRSARSLRLGYKMCAVIPVAGQRTHGTTFRALKVTLQVATPGAESAVYDCLVINATKSNIYVHFTAFISTTATTNRAIITSTRIIIFIFIYQSGSNINNDNNRKLNYKHLIKYYY